MQVNCSPAQIQQQGRAWIQTQTCELPWHSAELHRWASLLPTDSQNCTDVRCGHRICVTQEEGRESGTAPLAWRHSAPAHFCPPSPSLGIMDAHAELEVPLDPGKLDAEQFHGGTAVLGAISTHSQLCTSKKSARAILSHWLFKTVSHYSSVWPVLTTERLSNLQTRVLPKL